MLCKPTPIRLMRIFRLSVQRSHLWHDMSDLLKFAQMRLQHAHLQQVAGNLTFTTVLALVPLLTIALAVFTTFPQFGTLRASLEAYFTQMMMPKQISGPILGYLTTFASKAHRLSFFGAAALIFSAVAMVKMIETSFNQIWRIQQRRPLIRRYVLYLVIAILGPFVLGVSLTMTTHLYVATGGSLRHPSLAYRVLFTLLSVSWTACSFMLLYVVLPNRRVHWREALWGGLFAAIAFELAKRVFVAFIVSAPTYRMVYGAMAAIPLFLLWIYLSWLITLAGAALTAALHFIWYGRWRHAATPGSAFLDAIEILRVLFNLRQAGDEAGIDEMGIRTATGLGLDEIDCMLQTMQRVGWVGRASSESGLRYPHMDAIRSQRQPHWQLLAEPDDLTLAHVYRLFVFDAPDDTALAVQVRDAVERSLKQTLTAHFAAKAATA